MIGIAWEEEEDHGIIAKGLNALNTKSNEYKLMLPSSQWI